MIYVKKKKKKGLGSGPFPRDGRVTNMLFFRPNRHNTSLLVETIAHKKAEKEASAKHCIILGRFVFSILKNVGVFLIKWSSFTYTTSCWCRKRLPTKTKAVLHEKYNLYIFLFNITVFRH